VESNDVEPVIQILSERSSLHLLRESLETGDGGDDPHIDFAFGFGNTDPTDNAGLDEPNVSVGVAVDGNGSIDLYSTGGFTAGLGTSVSGAADASVSSGQTINRL